MIGLLSMLGLARGGVAVVAFVLLVAVCAVVGVMLLRRAQRPARVAWTLSGLSTVAALAITLWPDTGSFTGGCAVEFTWTSPFEVQNLANIALLIPATFFAAIACRRPASVLAAGSGLSAVIELAQALTPALHRACDTGDWQMNTIGALIGVAVGWWVTQLAARTSTRGIEVDSGGRYRLVTWLWTGASAAGITAWFAICALNPIPGYPCDEHPAGAATTLAGGIDVRAGSQTGHLCFLEPHGNTAASGDESVSSTIDTFGTGIHQWSIGIAGPEELTAHDNRGVEVQTHPVAGSELRAWSTYQNDTSAAATH